MDGRTDRQTEKKKGGEIDRKGGERERKRQTGRETERWERVRK